MFILLGTEIKSYSSRKDCLLKKIQLKEELLKKRSKVLKTAVVYVEEICSVKFRP
jgi:hypothetical protein